MSKEKFQLVQLKSNKDKYSLENFDINNAQKVKAYHESFDAYSETPLVVMENTAKELGIKNIYVKDESYRFGLNAFKVLGGSYAIGSYIAQKLGKLISELPFKTLISDEVRDKIGEITFVTATDGNHGRGVAWTANQLKQKAVVYMPKGSAKERLDNIKAEGADASITELNYDDAVRLANSKAESEGWVMVQDTAWDGYEDIPLWIMQGYATMGLEAIGQIEKSKMDKPTHVFLQAGVGSMASGVTAIISNYYKENAPKIIIVEPEKANCCFRTAQANDGKLHFVTDDMNTIMAGLACGEPCTIGWPILRDYAGNFVSCPDWVAAKGMRMLASPVKGDKNVVSGESGAPTFGLVAELMTNPNLKEIKEKLELDENSVVMCFSTEGDTDKKNYQKIVWDGLVPSENV